jgi:hypothetical protein
MSRPFEEACELGVARGVEEEGEVGDGLVEVGGENLMDRAGERQVQAARFDAPGSLSVLEASFSGYEVVKLVLALAVDMTPSMPGDLTFILEMIDEDDVLEAQLPPPRALSRRMDRRILLDRISILGIFSQIPLCTSLPCRPSILVEHIGTRRIP